jgi:hypothetical protein
MILFGYNTSPSYGHQGQGYGGFSFEISENGDTVFKEYIFGGEIKKEASSKARPDTVEKIQDYLRSKDKIIGSIPNKLSNGTRDGSYNAFIFNDKNISAWTIKRSDIAEVKNLNPKYYEKYKENMDYENTVLDLFDSICKILVNEGLELSLYSVR